MTDPTHRRRVPVGELIAFAALIVSALGVWIAWKSSNDRQPTRVVEQRQPIPLTLRGKVGDGGRSLEIAPVEAAHAIESLTLTIGGSAIQLGSDGLVRASDIQTALNGRDDNKGAHSVPVRIDASYVEMGKDRKATGGYVLRYEIEGGGLLGGRSLRLRGLSRA